MIGSSLFYLRIFSRTLFRWGSLCHRFAFFMNTLGVGFGELFVHLINIRWVAMPGPMG